MVVFCLGLCWLTWLRCRVQCSACAMVTLWPLLLGDSIDNVLKILLPPGANLWQTITAAAENINDAQSESCRFIPREGDIQSQSGGNK